MFNTDVLVFSNVCLAWQVLPLFEQPEKAQLCSETPISKIGQCGTLFPTTALYRDVPL